VMSSSFASIRATTIINILKPNPILSKNLTFKMSSEPCNQRRTTTAKTRYAAGAPLPDTEHLPCPHCDSTNSASTTTITSQPRHFYKACRRYMTHGGKLHDIPIVGGSQKNAKRLRLTTTHNIPPPFNPTTWLTLSPSNLNPLHKRTRRRVAFSCRQEIGGECV
ncbi:hypothetical protein R6Q59_016513, partial [Mikania micrantha]